MAQNSRGADVRAISIKLQSLLQIPSSETVTEPGQTTESFRAVAPAQQSNTDNGRDRSLRPADHLNQVGKSIAKGTEGMLDRHGQKEKLSRHTGHTISTSEPNSGSVPGNAFSAPVIVASADYRVPGVPTLGRIHPIAHLANDHHPTQIVPSQRSGDVCSQNPTEKSVDEYAHRKYTEALNVNSDETRKSSFTETGRDYDRTAMFTQLWEMDELPADIKNNKVVFMKEGVEDSRTSQGNYFNTLDTRVKGVFGNHLIDTLNKKSVKFPRAKFYCRACNYHLDSIYSSLNHIVQERHLTQEKSRKLDSTVRSIPAASKEHTDYLNTLILSVANDNYLTKSDQMQRLLVYISVREAIKKAGIDCAVTMFGSTVPGFGFSTSDLNINVSFPTEGGTGNEVGRPASPKTPGPSGSNLDISQQISIIVKALENTPDIGRIKESYSTKKPIVEFKCERINLNCSIHFNNGSGVWLACLFEEYAKLSDKVKPLVIAFRYFARMCEIDIQDNGLLPGHCYSIMVLHFLQQVGVIPVLHCLPRIDRSRPFAYANEVGSNWSSYNKLDVGQLWLGLLAYYSLEFDYRDRVVTISRTDILKRTDKYWNRRLSIEDPIVPLSNISRSVSNNRICDYIIDRIKTAYRYFSIPRTAVGPIYDGILQDGMANSKNGFIRTILLDNGYSSQSIKIVDSSLKMNERHFSNTNTSNEICKARMVKHMNHEGLLEDFVLGSDAGFLHVVLKGKDFEYKFDQRKFWDGTPPPLVCKSCGNEGHVRKECPEDNIPPLVEIGHPSELSLVYLKSVIYNNFGLEALNSDDISIRVKIAEEIQQMISRVYPDVRLTLFGSSQNKFGLRHSDIDVCMSFRSLCVPQGESPLKYIDVNEVLMNVVTTLKASGRITEILPITSAKVPIVKFRHKSYKLEGDISMYNLLAVHNTCLLRSYSDLDSRVGVLGCFLKKLGKICDISDASKASLSSYGYILMLIHFLQRHPVPVLPVLQEIAPINHPPGYPLPVRRMDGCDTYFFEDVTRIGEVWSGCGKNSDSIEQLWLAFLRYYTEIFDFETNVVSISQSQTLTRKNKSWYTNSIAIEDPFEKSHNLGSGLSRRMSVHIIKTLQRFRVHFHSSSDFIQPNRSYDWYMDLNKLRGGDPPIDRQCRLCNRIGHIARNCTYNGRQEHDSIVEEDDEPVRGEAGYETNSPQKQTNEGVIHHPASSTNTSCIGSQQQPQMVMGPPYHQTPSVYPFSPMSMGHQPMVRISYENTSYHQNGFMPRIVYPYSNVVMVQNKVTDPETRYLKGFSFFWNIGENPCNQVEFHLLEMVKKSTGVVFDKYVLRKARVVNKPTDCSDQANAYIGPEPKDGMAIPKQNPELLILNNGMNRHLSNNAPYRFNGMLMQYNPTTSGPMVFTSGMQPPRYSAVPNGFEFSNQVRMQGSVPPPPPGFAALFS